MSTRDEALSQLTERERQHVDDILRTVADEQGPWWHLCMDMAGRRIIALKDRAGRVTVFVARDAVEIPAEGK